MSDKLQIINGDSRQEVLKLPPKKFRMCMTSPPYWNLRDYGAEGQIGNETTPDEYVKNLTAVFAGVREALADDGTLWINLGDSFAHDGKWGGETGGMQGYLDEGSRTRAGRQRKRTGLKEKDLIGIPHMVAFSLRASGWYLRQAMPWVKKNAMPESCEDRPPSSIEYIFLLSKNKDYFYNAPAIRKPPSEALLKQVQDGYKGESTKDFFGAKAQDASGTKGRIISGMRKRIDKVRGHARQHQGFRDKWDAMTTEEQRACGSQRRNADWFFESFKGMVVDEDASPLAFVVNTSSFRGEHFATYPPGLITPCILAATEPNDWVLDPFLGSGTTAMVALDLGRCCTGIDVNKKYLEIAEGRTSVTPGLPLA